MGTGAVSYCAPCDWRVRGVCRYAWAMSTSPPPPPHGPNFSPQPSSEPSSDSRSGGAAVACWVAGGVELAVMGCCMLTMLLISFASPAQLQQADLPQGVTPGQLAVAARWIAGLLAVLMVVPGLVLLYLGFAVRQGRRGAMLAAGVILIVQAAVVAVLALLSILGSAMTGDVLGLALNVVVLGGVTALLVWAAWRVLRARLGAAGNGGIDIDDEPWNQNFGGGGW